MKKTLVTSVAVLFLLVTMVTAHASYTSTFSGSADYTLSWVPAGPITIGFTNANVVSIVPNFPSAGVYDWSMGLTSFAVDLNNGAGIDFGPLAFGPIDIGTYALPTLSAPGSANLGNVIIPFDIFGQGTGSLSLANLTVGWTMPNPNNDIFFTINATDLSELKGYLTQMDGYAIQEGYRGIGSGRVSASGWLTATSVPEPASMLLFGLGLLGLAGVRRKFKK